MVGARTLVDRVCLPGPPVLWCARKILENHEGVPGAVGALNKRRGYAAGCGTAVGEAAGERPLARRERTGLRRRKLPPLAHRRLQKAVGSFVELGTAACSVVEHAMSSGGGRPWRQSDPLAAEFHQPKLTLTTAGRWASKATHEMVLEQAQL